MKQMSPDKIFMINYQKFILKEKYISKNELKQFLENNYNLIHQIQNDINFSDDINKIRDIINNIELYINNHNHFFIKQKLIEEKEYFDNIFVKIDANIKLDTEQRIAILTEEDYSMIIAGAGSGKTTTMAAKVKYLVERLNINPEEILLISYTNKAVEELQKKINEQFKIPAKVFTFHKFGIDILKNNIDEPIKLLTNNYNIISDYFIKVLGNDQEKLKRFLDFFVYYFDIPTSALKFSSINEYHNYKKRNDFITLKSRLGNYNKKLINSRLKNKYTIKGEFLRSSEEVMIANFLYMNSIEYDYEKPYPYLNKGQVYIPDFTIYYGDKIYYLEHYGINCKGINNRYNERSNFRYKKGIYYKAKLHNKYNTELITTQSSYNDGKDLLYHLEQELIKRGINLTPINDKKIYDELVETSKDSYYVRFIFFCLDFIKGFKIKGYKVEDFEMLKEKYKDEKRTLLFLNFIEDLYKYYDMKLKTHNLIDFEDMINNSYELLKKTNKEEVLLNYKYIIIDEYQDISIQRFNLTKEVSKLSDAKVIAVGDDWQAIFAFAGSDVTLFTKFKELMGYGEELQITNTYRNSQELIDIAGKFVSKNKSQIIKKIKSKKRLSKPIVIMNYDDSETKLKNKILAVDECIKQIVNEFGYDKSILLIGRYNFDKYDLTNSDLFFEYEQDKIKSINYPNVNISFLTAHSSKGLGFDNVIIINGSEGIYGFPSQMKNDPIMDIIATKDDSFKFAEERRLFYVAITRTKNKVYITAPINNLSSFLLEIKEYPNVQIINKIGNSFQQKNNLCPICNFPLLKRPNNNLNINNLYVCSNEKEICDFMTNNLTLKNRIRICPSCKEGFLVSKYVRSQHKFILGCTNYNKNNKGCNYVIGIKNNKKKKLLN